MRTVRGLIGKLGFTVIGVGAGLILAAGSGVAAVHLTQTAATEHSIAVVQSTSTPEDRVHPEDASTRGTDDVAGTSKSDDAAEPEQEPEPADATDDSSSKPAADNSGDRSSQSTGSGSRSPEPGDDHGRDGSK